MTKKEILKEVKSTAIIVSFIAVLVLFTSLWRNKHFQSVFIYSSISYIILIVIFHLLGSKFKNKYFNKFTMFFSYPMAIFYAILIVIIPFMTLLVHVIFYFGIAFLIPEIIYITLNYFYLIDFISTPTILYLKITLTVFISVLLNPILRNIIYRIPIMQLKSSKKLKPYELDKLTDYFLSTNNVRFFVYGFYVIILLGINFFNFQGNYITQSIEADKSILQSFVTFIAFDRTIALMKQLDFKPSELLAKISKSISNKIKTENIDLD